VRSSEDAKSTKSWYPTNCESKEGKTKLKSSDSNNNKGEESDPESVPWGCNTEIKWNCAATVDAWNQPTANIKRKSAWQKAAAQIAWEHSKNTLYSRGNMIFDRWMALRDATIQFGSLITQF
jgi:hypothetical protein